MCDGPPCYDRPDVNVAPHPRSKFPVAELHFDLRKASNDLIHVGALGWVFLDHICDKWFHKLEAMVFLVCGSQKIVWGEMEENPDLDIVLSNQIPKVIHVSGERITRGLPVPVLRCRLVAASQRLIEW